MELRVSAWDQMQGSTKTGPGGMRGAGRGTSAGSAQPRKGVGGAAAARATARVSSGVRWQASTSSRSAARMASLSRVLWSVVVVKGPIIWNVGKPPAARTEASSAVVACVPWCFWAFESKEFQVVDVQLVELSEVVGVQLVELADVTRRAVLSREVAWRVDEAVRQMAGERITCIIAGALNEARADRESDRFTSARADGSQIATDSPGVRVCGRAVGGLAIASVLCVTVPMRQSLPAQCCAWTRDRRPQPTSGRARAPREGCERWLRNDRDASNHAIEEGASAEWASRPLGHPRVTGMARRVVRLNGPGESCGPR